MRSLNPQILWLSGGQFWVGLHQAVNRLSFGSFPIRPIWVKRILSHISIRSRAAAKPYGPARSWRSRDERLGGGDTAVIIAIGPKRAVAGCCNEGAKRGPEGRRQS